MEMTWQYSMEDFKRGLTDTERLQFDTQYAARAKSDTTALILSIFLGQAGIDRMYAGQVGLGVVKLITLGGFFCWWLVDLFLIRGVVREGNRHLAESIHGEIVRSRS